MLLIKLVIIIFYMLIFPPLARQLAAAGFIIVMLGAINLKARQMHRPFTGDGGWELDYALLCAAIALAILGAGPLSLDRLVFRL